jgi:predicted signal transduction protein with EAL and GGDEF domain
VSYLAALYVHAQTGRDGRRGEMGQTVVAEGIEDEPTISLLEELGVHFGQGFHLGVPTPTNDG